MIPRPTQPTASRAQRQRTPRRALLFALIAMGVCTACPEDYSADPGVVPPVETTEPPVQHPRASASCLAETVECFDTCQTDPANRDQSETAPLAFLNITRLQFCERRCVWRQSCFPWEIGQLRGPPCRTHPEDGYECNAYLCLGAATACTFDCDAFLTASTTPQMDPLRDCIEACYEHYGCRPMAHDPCNPLPAGFIYCGCPDKHGVQCHADGWGSCN